MGRGRVMSLQMQMTAGKQKSTTGIGEDEELALEPSEGKKDVLAGFLRPTSSMPSHHDGTNAS